MEASFTPNTDILDGRYRLIRLLGEGGMGAVFLVQDVFDEDRLLALKVLKPGLQKEIEAFRREFELLSTLRHPHIARVYSFGAIADSGTNYYTTEYIAGSDFYTASRDQNWDDMLGLLAQVCGALEYLHGRGILHRDIKPENILVAQDPLGNLRASLMDFGLALRGEASEVGFTGSLDYAAPELLKGKPADIRTDLYALGVLLYQSITGQLPFPKEDLAESLRKRLEIRPTRPSKFNASVPKPLEDVVLCMLEPNPEERPQGVRAIVERLSQDLDLPISIDTPESLRAIVFCGDYVERADELTQLNECARQFLAKGQRPLILIRGAFGCGKTRLLNEWKTVCQLEGLPFYYAQAREGEPFSILRTWLRQLLGEPSQAQKIPHKAQILEKHASALSALLANYYNGATFHTNRAGLSEKDQRIRFYEELYQVFTSLLKFQPAVLAADDVQEADGLTIDALRYILQVEKKPQAIWVLALSSITQDSDESVIGSANQQSDGIAALAQLNLLANVQIELGGFQEPQLEAYMKRIFAGQYPPVDFCQKLIENTGGVPLYIEESLLALLVSGAIRHQLGAWIFPADIAGLGIAEGFKEFLEKRLVSISTANQHLLQVISLSESALPAAILAQITHESEAAIETRLCELSSSNLISSDYSEGYVRVRLAHRTLAQKLHNEISEANRRKLASEIADLLMSKPNKTDWAGEIARQLSDAERFPEVTDWAVLAAKHARDSFQNDSAVQFYRLGLEALEASRGPLHRQVEIRMNISEIEALSGRMAEAIATLKDFTTLHIDSLDADQQIHFMEHLALVHEKKGELEEALSCWDYVLKHRQGSARARMLGNIGWIHFRKGDVRSALSMCLDGLSELKNDDDLPGQALIHNTLGRIFFYSGDLEATQKHWQQCLQIREHQQDKKCLADSHNNLGIVFSSRGEIEQARRHFETAMKLSAEVGDLLRVNGLLVNLGIMAFEAGELDLAQRHYRQALEFLRRSGNDREQLDCLNNLGEICLLRADYAAARSYWEECVRICSLSGYVQGTLEP
ncbi:MAG: tetratricopeptide repeat protein, partial [bacterium]